MPQPQGRPAAGPRRWLDRSCLFAIESLPRCPFLPGHNGATHWWPSLGTLVETLGETSNMELG
jgi:hypothetical protein